MISKAIKFTSLFIITLFALLPFIFFQGDNGLVFGTMFDQTIFDALTNISTFSKLLVPLAGTLSFALLILLIIFYLYEAFLETKTFSLVIIMNVMLITSLIVFSLYFYGFIALDNVVSDTSPIVVGKNTITSLTYNVALAGTMLTLVFILFVYSNVTWFPIVIQKFKSRTKHDKKPKKAKKQNLESETPNDDDDFDMLQPGLERNEIQQRKVSASLGRVPIDEFEEVHGLQLKTQVITNRDLDSNKIDYQTEVPKISREDIEIPKKLDPNVEQIFSEYEQKLKEDNFSPVEARLQNPVDLKDDGYIMPRNKKESFNASDDSFLNIPDKHPKSNTAEQEDMLRDSERIKKLLESKNKQPIPEFVKTEPIVEEKPKKQPKEKTKVLPKQPIPEIEPMDLTQVEDPLKGPNNTNTYINNIYIEDSVEVTEVVIVNQVPPHSNNSQTIIPKEDTYEEDTDEAMFNEMTKQNNANKPEDTYDEDTDEAVFNEMTKQNNANKPEDTYEEDTDEAIFNTLINNEKNTDTEDEENPKVTATIDWEIE